MEVKTSTREDGKTQVTVELTADEVKKHIDKTFKDLSKTRIPGFRVGKAPRKVIEQNFGGHNAVYAQITTDLINDVAPLAIDQEDIIFIADPSFDENDLVEEGKDYTFSLYGDVAPQVELSSYDPVEVKMPSEEVTDEDLKIQLDALQSYYYNFEDVDRPAQEGDYAMLKIESTIGGEPVESLTSESLPAEVGGSMLPQELSDALVGLKPGEVKELDFTTDYDPAFAGKTIHSELEITQLREKIAPELNDDLAKKVGFETYDEMCNKLKEEISEQKKDQLPRLKESRCVTELSKRIEGEIPAEYIDFTRENILREFFNSLQNQNVTFDQFLASRGITGEQFREDLEEQANEEAAECLALDALFRELGLELTEEDILEEFKAASHPEATLKAWKDAGRMSVIREAIRRQKATKWLVDNAVVTVVDTKDE